MAFIIEKNVPIRPVKGASEFWDLAQQMVTGDSVLLPGESEKNKLASAINNSGFGYKSRKEGSQIRVWKLEPHPEPRPIRNGHAPLSAVG